LVSSASLCHSWAISARNALRRGSIVPRASSRHRAANRRYVRVRCIFFPALRMKPASTGEVPNSQNAGPVCHKLQSLVQSQFRTLWPRLASRHLSSGMELSVPFSRVDFNHVLHSFFTEQCGAVLIPHLLSAALSAPSGLGAGCGEAFLRRQGAEIYSACPLRQMRRQCPFDSTLSRSGERRRLRNSHL
jgi:hypothetical protein